MDGEIEMRRYVKSLVAANAKMHRQLADLYVLIDGTDDQVQ
jgi:hypothetical protein